MGQSMPSGKQDIAWSVPSNVTWAHSASSHVIHATKVSPKQTQSYNLCPRRFEQIHRVYFFGGQTWSLFDHNSNKTVTISLHTLSSDGRHVITFFDQIGAYISHKKNYPVRWMWKFGCNNWTHEIHIYINVFSLLVGPIVRGISLLHIIFYIHQIHGK